MFHYAHWGKSVLHFSRNENFQNFDHFGQVLVKIAKILKIEGFEFPENCIIVLPQCAMSNDADTVMVIYDCDERGKKSVL